MRRQVKGEAVRRELLPGSSTELLKALHLLTRAGDLNADSLRKLKQVNHLVQLLAPALDDVLARFGDPVVVDCGAGKSYLGFILYETFLKDRGERRAQGQPAEAAPERAGGLGGLLGPPSPKGRLVAVESRPELVQRADALARTLGFDRMALVESPIEGAPVPERVHVVTALHACDTATDDALALAIRHDADHVAVVPCCQAEVARQLADATPAAPLGALAEHPWHRREFGSHLTNVIRALVLERHGYKVTVTELAGWEHSLKNELILGRKVRGSSREAGEKLDALLAATGVRPKLVRALAADAAGVPPGGRS